MKKYIKIIQLLLGVLFVIACAYIATSIGKIVYEEPQVFIDTSNLENNEVQLVIYHNNCTVIPMNKIDEYKYAATLGNELYNKEYSIEVYIDMDRKVRLAYINNQEIASKDIINFSDVIISKDFYPDIVSIKLQEEFNVKRILLEIAVWGLTVFIGWYIFVNKKIKPSFFIYSDTALKYISKKDLLVGFTIVTVTGVMILGSDVVPFANILQLQKSGVDIYQFQSAIQVRDGLEYLAWPYDSVTTIFWSLLINIYNSIFENAPLLNGIPYIQVYVFKLVNFMLICCTVLAIISFLIDQEILGAKYARKIYYIAVFNPLVFYVAIMYIHIDTLPMYLLIVGLLLLRKRKVYTIIPAMLLGLGLSCKSQVMLLLPTILITSGYLYIINDDIKIWYRIKKYIGFLSVLGLVMFIFKLMPLVKETPISVLLDYAPQAERTWYTTIAYAPGVYLYISILGLFGFTLINLFNFNSNCGDNNIILNGLMYYGIIMLVFSFSIMSTPASLLYTFAGFIIIFALSKDKVNIIVISCFSILLVIEQLIGNEGGIGNIFQIIGFGWKLSEVYSVLPEQNQIKLLSTIFTISKATMLAYALYFHSKAKVVLTTRLSH